MQFNSQPIEKSVAKTTDGSVLDLHSVFYTIQGEGPYAGHAAVFVRLAGCNLQCPLCDTDYTDGRKNVHYQDIVKEVCSLAQENCRAGNPIVVITGGEPFRQNISSLVNHLIDLGFTVQIETNGTLPPPRGMHVRARIVVSPKTGKVNNETEMRASAFKYVASVGNIDEKDGLPTTALGHTATPRLARPGYRKYIPIYLQPADHKDKAENTANLSAVVNSCMTFNYRLCVQLHKVVGVE